MRSTPRTFLRLDADGFRYVLRPVYDPPRPGKPSRPVTLREVYGLRVAVRVEPGREMVFVGPSGRVHGSRVGGLLGALGEAVLRRLV